MTHLLAELTEWLRIPSISTSAGETENLIRAATWAADRILAAGGSVAFTGTASRPLVTGELHASSPPGAPTVLVYGHYDVQGVGRLDEWATPPFEPAVRDGRIYARGAADDKGNFLPLLHAACDMAKRGTLPVNVRFLIDGEEEIGSASAVDWIRSDPVPPDCAIAFDALMADPETSALTIVTRGAVVANITVTSGAEDLHSGIYGGAAPNAAHGLIRMLHAVLPDDTNKLSAPLRSGVEPPPPTEREGWSQLPRAREFYERTWADASLDVNALNGGEPRSIIPCSATATLRARLVPHQSAAEFAKALDGLLRAAAPAGMEISIDFELTEPASFDPSSPPLKAAARALKAVTGRDPILVRFGATLPVLAAFAERSIPTIVSGFSLDDDGVHGPNESFRLSSLRLGERAARALYRELATLRLAGGH